MTDAVRRTCEICGRPPATPIDAVVHRGLGIFGDELFWRGDACRQCAVAQYRTGLTACLWGGWWSPVALFVNPSRVWRNARGLRAATRLPAPEGTPLAPPMDEGAPVWRRPQAWLGPALLVALVVAVGAAIVALTGSDGGISGLRTGDCIDLPGGVSVDRADVVACDGLHDAEVTGRVGPGPMPPLATLCIDETADYLGSDALVEGLRPAAIRSGDGDDVLFVCLVMSNDGTRLDGPQRGTAGTTRRTGG